MPLTSLKAWGLGAGPGEVRPEHPCYSCLDRAEPLGDPTQAHSSPCGKVEFKSHPAWFSLAVYTLRSLQADADVGCSFPSGHCLFYLQETAHSWVNRTTLL